MWWLDALPPALARQRVVLRRLLAAVERDTRWRFLALSCSVARGAGDADSDLDLALGVADDAWPGALDALPPLLAGLGAVVDALSHQLPEWGDRPHRRVFVQYADGVQIDLIAYPATLSRGRPPDTVVLYDPDGRLAEPWTPSVLRADAATAREWAFLGWVALADLAKYLRRGSLWEALERLHQARTYIWRLWAVAQGVDYPAFGLTGVLDDPDAGVPAGLDATVAALDATDLRRAALAAVALLDATSSAAASRSGAEAPTALAAYVRGRLEAPVRV